MKQARWGLLCVVVVVVLLACGCQYVPKLLAQSEYNRLNTLARLSERRGRRAADLQRQKDLLAAKLDAAENKMLALIAGMADNDDLLAMLRSSLDAKVSELEIEREDRLRAEVEHDRLKQEIITLGTFPPGIKITYNPLFGVGIVIPGDLLFSSGSAKLKKDAPKLMTKISQIEALRDSNKLLRICGFTDSDPIKRSAWQDNFALSSGRAHAVLRALKNAGISSERMHIIGFGPNMLVKENGKENKKQSRRVEIYLVPKPKPSADDEFPVDIAD